MGAQSKDSNGIVKKSYFVFIGLVVVVGAVCVFVFGTPSSEHKDNIWVPTQVEKTVVWTDSETKVIKEHNRSFQYE